MQNNTNSLPPLAEGLSLARTRINLCVFLHHHLGKGSTHTNSLIGVTPHGENTDNTAQLVDDYDLAKALFKTLRGQIPADAEEVLFQATHLENRQLQYQRATQRLADRPAHAQLSEEMMKVKLLADEKHKNIDILKSSGYALKHKISL